MFPVNLDLCPLIRVYMQCGIGMYNKAKIDSRRRQQAKEQVNTVNKGPFYV